jgi:hypothetical protein
MAWMLGTQNRRYAMGKVESRTVRIPLITEVQGLEHDVGVGECAVFAVFVDGETLGIIWERP